jgi:hypothetical protein
MKPRMRLHVLLSYQAGRLSDERVLVAISPFASSSTAPLVSRAASFAVSARFVMSSPDDCAAAWTSLAATVAVSLN